MDSQDQHPNRPAGGQPLIEVRNLSRVYRMGEYQVHALRNVDLTIAAGEYFVLLGPSGGGKTTLLRMLAGFERPNSGSILIDGQDMTAVPPYERPVNMMFQSYALFPHMTVAKNVAFGLRMSGVGKEETARRVREALELVKLTGYDDRSPTQLSGGQRQRVAIARALVMNPKVLLLDESLSALDHKLRQQMQIWQPRPKLPCLSVRPT